jgi:hypothetical protein
VVLKRALATLRPQQHHLQEHDVSLKLAAPAVAHHPARDELLREAEAHRALAELFPHLKLDALRAIQDLFPLNARRNAQAMSMH